MNNNKSTSDKRIMGYVVEWKVKEGETYRKWYATYEEAAKAERWVLTNGCDQCYVIVQLNQDIQADGEPVENASE